MCERRPLGGGKLSVLSSTQLQQSCGGRKEKKQTGEFVCMWEDVKERKLKMKVRVDDNM